MRITPMPQFFSSARIYLTSREVLGVEKRLLQDPKCGKQLHGVSENLRRLKHPTSNTSELGYSPVVIYLLHEASNEIILLDVTEDDDKLASMLKNPFTLVKIYSLLRAIRDALEFSL